MSDSQNKKIILQKINNHIDLLSKNNTSYGEPIHWFQQSPLHWFLILYIMKYYLQQIDLSKKEVIEHINHNVMQEGKKTATTEFKYINDAIAKGYIIASQSKIDGRRVNLLPSNLTAEKMIHFFKNYSH